MNLNDPLDLIEELDDEAPPVTFEKIKKSASRGSPGETAAGRHRMPRRLLERKKTPESAVRFIQSQDDSAPIPGVHLQGCPF